MTDTETALAWLKMGIEALSELPGQQSFTAYTHRRTPHVSFHNGVAIHHGEEKAPPPAGPLIALVEATLAAVRAYAESVPGPRLLVWRVPPEITPQLGGLFNIYCRLAFDTDTDTLASAYSRGQA